MAKNKNSTLWLGLAIVVVVAGIVWANWDQLKAILSDGTSAGDGLNIPGIGGGGGSNNPTPGTGGGGGGTTGLNYNKLLKIGVEGAEVIQLQQWLNLLPGNNLVEDGIFGNLTKAALQAATGQTQITLAQAQQLMANYLNDIMY